MTPPTPTIADLTKLKNGDLFTVLANEETYTEGKIAAGRIFQIREIAYPYVFANHLSNTNRWVDSPWRLILDQGISLIKLTQAALPYQKKKKNKKNKK